MKSQNIKLARSIWKNKEQYYFFLEHHRSKYFKLILLICFFNWVINKLNVCLVSVYGLSDHVCASSLLGQDVIPRVPSCTDSPLLAWPTSPYYRFKQCSFY